jgi:hypothetical protein
LNEVVGIKALMTVGLCAAGVLASGCGGEDAPADPAADVRATVERLLTSSDPAICSELVTESFLERARDATGSEARLGCATEIAGRTGSGAEGGRTPRIGQVEISDGEATAELLGSPPVDPELKVALIDEGGTWKLDDVEVVGFDRAAYLRSLREQLALAQAFGSGAQARCRLRLLSRLTEEQLASLATGEEEALAERLNTACER